MPAEEDRSRLEELFYYLYLMAGRGYSGSCILWMYGGRVSKGTFQKLRNQLRLAGVPFEDRDTEEELAHAAESQGQG